MQTTTTHDNPPTNDDLPVAYSRAFWCKRLGISEPTLLRAELAGTLKVYRVGTSRRGRVLISPAQIEAWLHACEGR